MLEVRRAITTTLMLLHCSIINAHIRVDAPEVHYVPEYPASFVRSAVERTSAEEVDFGSAVGRFTTNPSFGDVFLPLRSAVESVPILNLRNANDLRESAGMRYFVRDSVESVPNYYENDGDNDSQIGSVVRTAPDSNNLNSEMLHEEKEEEEEEKDVESIGQVNTLTGADRYAAFVEPSIIYDSNIPQHYRSDSPYQQLVNASDFKDFKNSKDMEIIQESLEESEDLAPYGALAQLKSGTKQKNFNTSPKVLCYLTNWAFYRKADGQFVPEQLDERLCTAVIYSFASLDPDHLNIKEFDPWVDIENGYYRRTVERGVPVLIAMGGWTDSTGDKYSRLASDDIKRKVFAGNLIGFLKRNGFAGLHLDWNYPKCWQSDCSKGPISDKPNLTKLLREIRTEFDRVDKNLQLGVAISGYKEVITEAYEFAELSKIVDYLTVMTYDYHGAWEYRTGHVSPLYGRKGDTYPQYNTDYAMQLLLKLGAKKEKLIMGIPLYGQTFTLTHASNSLVGEGTLSSGPGEPGEYTKQPGMLGYYEICQRIRKNKWLTGRDPIRRSGPFSMLHDQWVGYEDAASVEAKARYAANNGFGGIAAWTVDLDDFQNRCCIESFPLLKSINRALGRLSSPPPSRTNCDPPPPPVTPIPPEMTTVSSDGSASGTSTFSSTHKHTTTIRPTWTASSTTTMKPFTNERPVETTTKPTTTMQPDWWSSTSSTLTTKRYTPSLKPTKPGQQPHHTTIPSPAVVRPVVQASNCEAGKFYRDHSNCNAYYQCITPGELRQQFCPGGLHWNDVNHTCDWPASAQCSMKKEHRTSQTPSLSTPTKPTTRPHQTIRTSSRPVRPSTASTTLSLNTLSTTQHLVTHRTSRKPAMRPNKPSAKCNEGDYYSHRKCGLYYICINGALVPNSCGSNLHWDAIRKLCDWPENVKCLTTKRYLRFFKPSLRLTQIEDNQNDPCNGQERVPYPGDCTKFLFCLWNRLQAGDCGPGLHFNPTTGICDWPTVANCDKSGESGVESGNAIPQSKPTVHTKPAPSTKSPRTTARPTYSTAKPVLAPLDGYYKVVCYFTNWAWYRQGLGRYTPDDINTDLCTHIVYGFAVLDYSNLILRTHDSWADIDNNFYTRVSSIKNKGVKVSLALGGWNDSQGDKYSRLVRNPEARARFVKHAIDFIEKYGFEGLDLDWEYPVCWQTECNKGMPDEKEAFTALVRELSQAFKSRGLLLSTAVSPSKKIIDAGYDVHEISKYFDWIAVMTYDFHGQWDKKTGHVAPLFFHPDDDYDYFNANFSLHYWIEKGAPPRKIVMGVPLYGQSFTLENANNNGLNAKAPGPGKAGEYTRAAGFLAYYEICDRIKNQGWEVVQDERGRMGPFARKGNQWVSYDDINMIRKKAQLVRALDLGGGMVWALDLDDFRNRCGDGIHPLLTQIHDVLKDAPKQYEPTPGLIPVVPELIEEGGTSIEIHIPINIETENEHEYESGENIIDPNEDVEECDFGLEAQSEVPLEEDMKDFKVVCYFTNWAWYRQNGGKYLPEDIDADLCTHVVYGFAVLNSESLTIQPHDSWADLDNKFYERVTALRIKNVKVTVAIGGWNDSAGDKYARLVRAEATRNRFVRNVVDFIEKYGFDGLDLDWEYPVCWQVDCKKGTADEREGFTDLVRELSEAFQSRGLLLSAAVSPNKRVIDAGYDVPQLSRYFDWIALMAYDYHGQWDKKTGHVAPMYDHPDGTATFNVNFSVNYWLQSGAERRKLVMGMPMYGQSFTLANAMEHHLNAATYGGGEAGGATRARGFLSYYEICTFIRKRGWNVVRDMRGRMGPYAYLRDQWVSFDDAPMIRHKSEYIRAMGLGGAMIWALDLDDFKNDCDCESYPLLKTINRVLRNYPGAHPNCKLEVEEKTMRLGPSHAYIPKPTGNNGPTASKGPDSSETSHSIDCNGSSYASHERDCNKYYICQFGELIEQRCPQGLHWNEDHCDWPPINCFVRKEFTTKRPLIMHAKPKPTSVTIQTKNPTKGPFISKKTTPHRIPTHSVPSVSSNSDYKIVCYFTNWAWYRPGQGSYIPEDIDENLCTHIVYGFAVLNRNSLTIQPHDSWADIDNRFYERIVAFKKNSLRVTVAIGGWNDSLGSKYARLVLDPEARTRFVKSVLDFLYKYGFEGLDLDWEYPVCWQVDCSKGSSAEKQGFTALVRELSAAFKIHGFLLSAAVSPSKAIIDAGYDVPLLAKYLDWIGVMTYDFHGHWDKQTGHVAPLYFLEGDFNEYFNGNFSIYYWIEKGVPPNKLIMGLPLYGQSFSLADINTRGLNTRSNGPGFAGPYTRAKGFLAYYEICEKIGNGGWNVVRDPKGRIGPYAYSGNQWISYDDVADIRRKSQFIRNSRLGGGMVWALDLDDFRGRCGCGKHPLLRTLYQELHGIPGQRANDCT